MSNYFRQRSYPSDYIVSSINPDYMYLYGIVVGPGFGPTIPSPHKEFLLEKAAERIKVKEWNF